MSRGIEMKPSPEKCRSPQHDEPPGSKFYLPGTVLRHTCPVCGFSQVLIRLRDSEEKEKREVGE